MLAILTGLTLWGVAIFLGLAIWAACYGSEDPR